MRDRELRSLRSLIEFASAQAEKLFRRQGSLLPMYHAIKTSGETVILPMPDPDKDVGVAMIKAWFLLNDIDRYVFMDEAWILDTRPSGGTPEIDMEKIAREGLRKHPDRRECVHFSAENRRGEIMTGIRFILRPEHGKATLSPLRVEDMTGGTSEGRMVGLLKMEK
jgi:hypothetical protein